MKPNKQKTDWEKEFWKNVTEYNIEDIKSETIYLVTDDNVKNFISQLLKEIEGIVGEEYDNGFEDGCEQTEKEVKKELLSEIESKSILAKAYENGPVLADSLMITYDDWLEIKSGRKSKISYKSIKQNETDK